MRAEGSSVLLVTGTKARHSHIGKRSKTRQPFICHGHISGNWVLRNNAVRISNRAKAFLQRLTIQTKCLPHSTTYMNKGYRAFPGVNHLGRGTDHAPPLGPVCEQAGAIPAPALCACISMSLGGLYLYLTTPMITQLLQYGYRVISRGKATGAWRSPPTPFYSPEETAQLYSPSGPSWPAIEWTFYLHEHP